MKVLFINDCISKGGKERRMLELIKYLTGSKNLEVVLVILSDKIEYSYVHELPIKLITIKRKTKYDPFVFFKLLKVCKSQSPDIIHSWSSMANLYSLPIAKITKCRFVTSVISNAYKNLSFRNKEYWRFKLIYPFADVVTSNSTAGLEAYKVPAEKSFCIYNGFDFNRINVLEDQTVLKKKLSIENKVIVGMVATFDHRKDYPTLLKAAFTILKNNKNIVFILIGDGPLKKQIVESVPEKFKTQIKFLGKIDNVESYINIFDIAVLSSPCEGISNSILESMALEKPVIATDGGGTKEIVVDNVTGYLIPPADSNILAAKINHLINHPEQQKAFGRKGQDRVKEVFSIEKMCSKFYSIYEELLPNS